MTDGERGKSCWKGFENNMQWNREQYLELMTFGDFPRPMFVEIFGLLIGLEAEWRAQGATQQEIDLSAFDFDRVLRARVPANTGPIDLPAEEIIEETEDQRLTRDGLGRTTQLDKRTATIPLPLTFPVATMDDWLKLKPHFQYKPERVDEAGCHETKARQAEGEMTCATIPGGYDMLRELMGEEMVAYACVDQPELVNDILETLRDTAMQTLNRASRIVTIDHLFVHEDMAGKSGPMFGPSQVREYLLPYYRPVWDMLADRGSTIFNMDTDGNVMAIMDDLSDCGLNLLHPMEPAAGMDLVECRKRFGRKWAYVGGIDKFALLKGREAIDCELDAKLTPELIREGGVAFGLDHRIPNGVHIENYRYYVRSVRQRLGLPSLNGN